jgi:hypothetical protein
MKLEFAITDVDLFFTSKKHISPYAHSEEMLWPTNLYPWKHNWPLYCEWRSVDLLLLHVPHDVDEFFAQFVAPGLWSSSHMPSHHPSAEANWVGVGEPALPNAQTLSWQKFTLFVTACLVQSVSPRLQLHTPYTSKSCAVSHSLFHSLHKRMASGTPSPKLIKQLDGAFNPWYPFRGSWLLAFAHLCSVCHKGQVHS